MYTIKQASRLTGVPAATLRAWERRYEVVRPTRNASGYRVYDDVAIAAIVGLRRLIDAGWAPMEAAAAIRDGTAPSVSPGSQLSFDVPRAERSTSAGEAFADFLEGALRLDSLAIDDSLDRAFATGSFEFVAENWLFPVLVALGEEWASGKIEVAGEHLASQAVRRRLSAAFEAAGSRSRGPSVLVGLPAGSQHELGAFVFAVAARRRGLDVHYLGADLPAASWVAAVDGRRVDAAVLAIVMTEDRYPAKATVRALRESHPELLVAVGGAHCADLHPDVVTLPPALTAALDEVDDLLHRSTA